MERTFRRCHRRFYIGVDYGIAGCFGADWGDSAADGGGRVFPWGYRAATAGFTGVVYGGVWDFAGGLFRSSEGCAGDCGVVGGAAAGIVFGGGGGGEGVAELEVGFEFAAGVDVVGGGAVYAERDGRGIGDVGVLGFFTGRDGDVAGGVDGVVFDGGVCVVAVVASGGVWGGGVLSGDGGGGVVVIWEGGGVFALGDGGECLGWGSFGWRRFCILDWSAVMSEKNEKAEKGEGRFAYGGIDRVIHEKARLSIVASLAAHPEGLQFTDLKELCALTDGNLSRHLGVLVEAGVVKVEKDFVKNRPQTWCKLTGVGRKRFGEYVAELERVVGDAVRVKGQVSGRVMGA